MTRPGEIERLRRAIDRLDDPASSQLVAELRRLTGALKDDHARHDRTVEVLERQFEERMAAAEDRRRRSLRVERERQAAASAGDRGRLEEALRQERARMEKAREGMKRLVAMLKETRSEAAALRAARREQEGRLRAAEEARAAAEARSAELLDIAQTLARELREAGDARPRPGERDVVSITDRTKTAGP